jgi:hypothetical protein
MGFSGIYMYDCVFSSRRYQGDSIHFAQDDMGFLRG